MKTYLTRACAAGAFLAVAASVQAQLWNFDADAQGWQIADFTGSADYTTSITNTAVTYHAAGGNLGGYISSADPTGGTFLFQAPSASLGNYLPYLGGTLSFSLQTNESADWLNDSVVVFRNTGGLTIVAPIVAPGMSWSEYSIDLVAASFRYDNASGATVSHVDLNAVLADLSTFLINGEYHNGISEITSLDFVSFAPRQVSPGAVPEPATYALFGSAFLAIIIAVRRRK